MPATLRQTFSELIEGARPLDLRLTMGISLCLVALYQCYSLLNVPGTNASPLWMPTGFAYAMLFLFRGKALPGVYIGLLAGGCSTTPLLAALPISLVDLTGALLAYCLCPPSSSRATPFEGVSSVRRYVIGPALLVQIAVALLDVGILCSLGFIPVTHTPYAFVSWWTGNALGMLMFAPLIITSWGHMPHLLERFRERTSLVLTGGSLLIACGLVFSAAYLHHHIYELSFLLIPLFLSAALRLPLALCLIILLLTGAVSLFGLIRIEADLNSSMLFQLVAIQTFNGISTILILIVHAATLERRRSEARLMDIEHVASLGHLVAGMAHELATPIGNARTASSTQDHLLQKLARWIDSDRPSRQEARELIHDMQTAQQLTDNSCRRAAHIIERFREVTAPQPVHNPSAFMLAECLRETLRPFEEPLRIRGIFCDVSCDETVVLFSQPELVEHILSQLLTNSLQHGFTEGMEGTIAIRVFPEGSWMVIDYRDNGQGIDERHLRRIFDPFFTTQMGQGGNGLGLYIAHNIAMRLQGDLVLVPSENGRGAHFQLRLPVRV